MLKKVGLDNYKENIYIFISYVQLQNIQEGCSNVDIFTQHSDLIYI